MKACVAFGQNAVDPQAPDYQGWTGILNGCVPDARDLAIAAANMGYEAEGFFSGWNVGGKMVPWVMSSECTLAQWKGAHQLYQGQAKPGDTIIISNSGHGGQYDASGQVNGGEFECFYDGLLYDTEQHDLFLAWPAGVNVLYILDSCHSGGVNRDFLRAPVRSAPALVKPAVPIVRAQMRSEDIQARILVFCACMASETAEDGPHNGAFTGSLLAVWQQTRGSGKPITFKDWFDGTVGLMSRCFPAQHPVLNVLGAGSEMLDTCI